jgi:putative membrane protein
MTMLLKWALCAAALIAVAYLYPGVHVDGFVAALIAALVLGIVNTLVRPVLVILTLPVTILTLGLFLFVINALMFWMVGSILTGFKVDGFVAALIGSLIYSALTLLINWMIKAAKD